MTAQAVAKQMIRFGNGGSIVMIASMSGTVANRVYLPIKSASALIYTNNFTFRASSAPRTTPPKRLSFNSGETSPPNGASMASVSTPFRQATSSRLW
jgi:hypothetical protein